MESLAGPRLLQAFFDHATNGVLDSMDNLSKARLRLSCKNAKVFVDGTVTTAKGDVITLETILRCDWHLIKVYIEEDYPEDSLRTRLMDIDFPSLLSALCSKFSTLKVLEINASPIYYNLPANIGQLSKLNTVKINYACFRPLPASFGQLSLLERLELNEVYGADTTSRQLTIEALAPLKQLTQLKYLNLHCSMVGAPFFPDWLCSCHFPVLEDLILTGSLHSLPSSISNFRSLMTLTIYAGIFTEVPASIGSLKLLKKLCLGGSQSVSLPTSLSKLTALEDLHVTTDLQNFAVVEHLNKLTKLAFFPHMEEEVIVSYPEFVWTFTSLQILLLVQSSVASLPDAFGNLKQLKVLYLGSHFSLESLPESFGNLTCLTDLCIINCPRLLNLPESIGNLQLLTRLEISSCRHITTLPDSTGNLQRLEELILTNDEVFERLPSSIGNLHALKLLIVEDAGEVFLFPESFADLVLDKPIEECSLEKVFFQGEMKLVAAGPRVTMALNLLKERGVLQLYCGQGFGFP